MSELKFKFTEEELDEINGTISEFNKGGYFMNHITDKIEVIMSERWVSDEDAKQYIPNVNIMSDPFMSGFIVGVKAVRSRIFKNE